MRIPVRPVSGRWPTALEHRARRYFWPDARVLVAPSPSAEQFRVAMSALHVGGTIKITDRDRHPAADALLLDHLDLSDSLIVDIGASDGSTSVDLIGKIPDFRAYVIADLYLHLSTQRLGSTVLFYDPAGECTLIAGGRLTAWPSISRLVRGLCKPVMLLADHSNRERLQVLLLNPEARALVERDQRVTYRTHDVFEPWAGEPPDVIKVANLLRRLYFSDEKIAQALTTLLSGLRDRGHLLIVDNPRVKGTGPRGGLFQRCGDHFELVAQTPHPAEVSDLVLQARLS